MKQEIIEMNKYIILIKMTCIYKRKCHYCRKQLDNEEKYIHSSCYNELKELIEDNEILINSLKEGILSKSSELFVDFLLQYNRKLIKILNRCNDIYNFDK